MGQNKIKRNTGCIAEIAHDGQNEYMMCGDL